MSARCCAPTTPKRVLAIDGHPAVPLSSMEATSSATISARLLDDTFCTLPPLPSRDFGALLKDMRDRQEELFMQVLDQQKELKMQLSSMSSTLQESVESNVASMQQNEDFIAAISATSSRLTKGAIGTEGTGTNPKASTLVADRASSSEQTELTIASAHSFHDLIKKDKKAATSLMQKTSFKTGESVLDRVEDAKAPHAKESYAKALSQMPEDQRGSSVVEFMKKHKQSGMYGDVDIHGSFLSRMRYVLQSKEFEIAIAVAILSNALIMSWECQFKGLDVGFNLQFPGRPKPAQTVWPGAETVFTLFDWFFGLAFLLEAIMKIVCWRGSYFYRLPSSEDKKSKLTIKIKVNSDEKKNSPCLQRLQRLQGWNLLDFFCVTAFLAGRVAAAGALNPQTLRLLRLFRLGRLVRLLRFLESLDHLYVMTTAISGLQQVLFWAIILLTMMLLTCDLFLVQILQDTYFDKVKASDLTEDQLNRYHRMYEYFGTCSRCMLSMFEITMGNWPPIARLLSEEVSQWFTFFCLVHKLTIGFAVIGVITGVILQETFKVAQTDDIIMFRQKKLASATLRRKMQALFDALDDSRDGKLEVAEFKMIAEVPEIKVWLGSLGFETDDLQTLFSLVDVEDNGFITVEELIARMPRIQGTSRSLDVLALQRQLWNLQKGEHRPMKEQSSFADFLLELPQRNRSVWKNGSLKAEPSNGH